MLICASMLPGACVCVTLGDRGRRDPAPLMPRADARLLAIEELISLGGMRRGVCMLCVTDLLSVACGSGSLFFARSSATAAEVETFFSSLVVISASVVVGVGGACSSSDSR